MLFKVIKGKTPHHLINILLELNGPRNYILQNNSNLKVPLSRLEYYKKSFCPRAISLWNYFTVESQSKDNVENLKNTENYTFLLSLWEIMAKHSKEPPPQTSRVNSRDVSFARE